VFTFRAILQNFDEGQVNILMMTLAVAGLYFVLNKKHIKVALLLGFSMMVKYMPVILIPYLIIKKKFKLVGFIFLALALFILIPIFTLGIEYGLSLTKEFMPFLFESCMDSNSISTHPNQSLLAMLMRFLHPSTEAGINIVSLNKNAVMGIFIFVSAVLYLFIIIPTKSKPKDNSLNRLYSYLDYSLIFICMALFNPNAWKHAYIFLIPAYMIAVYYLIRINFKDKVTFSLVTFSFFLTSIMNQFILSSFLPKETFENYSTITFGALILFLCILRLKYSSKKLLSFIDTEREKQK